MSITINRKNTYTWKECCKLLGWNESYNSFIYIKHRKKAKFQPSFTRKWNEQFILGSDLEEYLNKHHKTSVKQITFID